MYAMTSYAHLSQDEIALRGEVYFPNLGFEKSEVDFGCILNDTEVTRYVNITNTSPMDVHYKWSFLIDDQPVAVFHPRPEPQVYQSCLSNHMVRSPSRQMYSLWSCLDV